MKARFGLHLPKLVFMLAFLPGLAVTVAVYTGAERRLMAEFEQTADLAIGRVVTRIQQHVVVLRAARGLLSAHREGISRDEFLRFLSSVDIIDELAGVQGIGFARMVDRFDTRLARQDVQRHYGLDIDIRPESDQRWRTPIVLLEPDNARNRAALGYDMYSEPTRRTAMDGAVASGSVQMTGPVELVQEITEDKQTGFLIYLPFEPFPRPPLSASPPVAGFVYAPFRGGDLIRAALATGPPLVVALRVIDAGAPETPLFDESTSKPVGSLHHSRGIDILGRQWVFDAWSMAGADDRVSYLPSLLLGLTSFLFAAAAALAVSARQQEAVQARAVAAAAARESEYRALLLQEMKHRIKNHISRIQSIARQSARGALDVKAFITAFDARLQSMSALQDILSGTAAAQADIRAILASELQQSLDARDVEHRIDGPAVRLDERQAHAFALVVHELVTNAMKYGGLSARGRGLSIRWSILRDANRPQVDILWQEKTEPGEPPPAVPGFGSRLVDAGLKGELSGTLERSFSPTGLEIRILFPVDPVLNPPSAR